VASVDVAFASEIVAKWVRGIAMGLSAVTGVIGQRFYALGVAPQGDASTFPLGLHYAESVTYTGPLDGPIAEARLRYAVRFGDRGESTSRIRPAAEAMLDALHMRQETIDGIYIEAMAVGEWPITTLAEGGVIYRQLGNHFDITVMDQGA
jgi:hypothetical protein